MTEKPFDPMNDYGLERKIFNLMADCINCLCEFEEITVAQVETREDGLDIHLWSERYQHQIEIDRELNTVTLAILPLDGVTAVPVFTAEADEAGSVRESSDACSSAGVACSPCGRALWRPCASSDFRHSGDSGHLLKSGRYPILESFSGCLKAPTPQKQFSQASFHSAEWGVISGPTCEFVKGRPHVECVRQSAASFPPKNSKGKISMPKGVGVQLLGANVGGGFQASGEQSGVRPAAGGNGGTGRNLSGSRAGGTNWTTTDALYSITDLLEILKVFYPAPMFFRDRCFRLTELCWGDQIACDFQRGDSVALPFLSRAQTWYRKAASPLANQLDHSRLHQEYQQHQGTRFAQKTAQRKSFFESGTREPVKPTANG